VAVIRGVIPEDEARSYKFEIEEYARQNPQTRGKPSPSPQRTLLFPSILLPHPSYTPPILSTPTIPLSFPYPALLPHPH
jgi:hypothetical protein